MPEHIEVPELKTESVVMLPTAAKCLRLEMRTHTLRQKRPCN